MEKKRSVNLKDMKRMNKAAVLHAIWRRQEISRTELSEATGLSPATVSVLTEELLAEKIISEVRVGESSGGRKPILLQINPGGGLICAVNVLPETITYTLFDMHLDTIDEFVVKNSAEIVIQRLFENLITNIDRLLSKRANEKNSLIGIGISISREYDEIDKKVLLDTGVSADRMELDQALRFQYQTSVFVEFGINARAIAEYHLGVAKNMEAFVCIDIGESIQAAVVQKGQIVKNPLLQSSSLGHMIIDRNGPKCNCGQRGCLGLFSTIGAIVRRAKLGLMEGKRTLLQSCVGEDVNKVNYDVVAHCANKGDSLLLDIIREAAEALCIGIVNFLALFRIRDVVISGTIRKAHFFPQALIEAAKNYGFMQSEGITILEASVPEEAVNIGNGANVLSHYFQTV